MNIIPDFGYINNMKVTITPYKDHYQLNVGINSYCLTEEFYIKFGKENMQIISDLGYCELVIDNDKGLEINS